MRSLFNRLSPIFMLLISLSWAVNSHAVETDKLTEQEVIDKLLGNYPSLKLAQLEVERARQEFKKIESQLGWGVALQSGVSRDVNNFDIPGERFDASVQLGATDASGRRLDITGQYIYEDSDSTAIPGITNPSERTRLDLSYRIPLGQGSENPVYKFGLLSAEAGFKVTRAVQQKQIDALIRQVVNLYYDAAATFMRIRDADEGIERASRLLAFVRKNAGLGLSERKDVLNIQAQLSGKLAERDSLLVAWSAQRTEINRLIGRESGSEFEPEITAVALLPNRQTLLDEIYQSSSDLILQEAQLERARSEIELARDAQKDKLDVVLSVGARNTRGDSASGDVDNSEWASAARLEYQYSFDRRGIDAGLYQAMLQEDTVNEEINRLKRDLEYQLASLLERVDKNLLTIKSMKKRLGFEKEKVKDAFQRYKVGRSDTRELVDNENSLSASSLAYKTRKIELARIYFELSLLQGKAWDRTRLVKEN